MCDITDCPGAAIIDGTCQEAPTEGQELMDKLRIRALFMSVCRETR